MPDLKKFMSTEHLIYDAWNTAYCELMLSTPASSPERHWIVDNADKLELLFRAGYNAR